MMVVTEQHNVDGSERFGVDSWTSGPHARGAQCEGVPVTRWVEGEVDENPPPSELDEDGRAPDPCDFHGVS